MLVVIDNFAEFKEYYEGLMGALISLIREARAYGVHFLITADVTNALTGKLFNLITERFTLKLSDSSGYSDVVGRGVPADLSSVPGRGYVRVGNMPLEFQTALSFIPEENDPDNLSKIAKMCTRMQQIWNNSWKGEKPSTVETLPMRVSLDGLLHEAEVPKIKRLYSVLGIDDRSLHASYNRYRTDGSASDSDRTTILRKNNHLAQHHSFSGQQLLAGRFNVRLRGLFQKIVERKRLCINQFTACGGHG